MYIQWDDFFDEVNEGSLSGANRVTLPSPKRTKVSPLKKYEFKKITTRRKPMKWSTLEEDTLRTGVQKYGASLTSSDINEVATQGLAL